MKFNRTDVKYKRITDFIRGEMKRRKISQKEVAEWLNIPQGGVSKRLNGEVEWSLREIISLSELLEIGEKSWKSEVGLNLDR